MKPAAAAAMSAPVRAGRAALHLLNTLPTCSCLLGCSRDLVSSLGILHGLNVSRVVHKQSPTTACKRKISKHQETRVWEEERSGQWNPPRCTACSCLELHAVQRALQVELQVGSARNEVDTGFLPWRGLPDVEHRLRPQRKALVLAAVHSPSLMRDLSGQQQPEPQGRPGLPAARARRRRGSTPDRRRRRRPAACR